MMQVSYGQLKRLFVILVLFGLIVYNIHSFTSIPMTRHQFKSDYHHQQQELPKQEHTGLSIHTIIRAVEGFVDQKLTLMQKDEEYLRREVRALREHQRVLEAHIQDLELKKSEPEIRTTKIELQHWYDIWKEEGLHIYPPSQSSIIINVGTNDILSNAIIETGYWSIDKLRDIIVVLSSMPPNVNYPNSNTVPFVDIGANLGWFTLTVAGWGYYVESFEPMPLNNLLLSKSLRDNGMTDRVKHHPACLDLSKRSCAIISSEGNMNDGLSICESDENRLEESIKNTVFAPYHVRAKLNSSTLDDEFPTKDIYLMKIDVEGWEENVLTRGGAESLFRKRRVYHIISEVWVSIDFNHYLTFFSNLGYELTTGGFSGKQISSNITKEEFKEEFGEIVYVYMKKSKF